MYLFSFLYTVCNVLLQVNHLNDTHKQLMVHWVGENTKVVICLARDVTPVIPGKFTSHHIYQNLCCDFLVFKDPSKV